MLAQTSISSGADTLLRSAKLIQLDALARTLAHATAQARVGQAADMGGQGLDVAGGAQHSTLTAVRSSEKPVRFATAPTKHRCREKT